MAVVWVKNIVFLQYAGFNKVYIAQNNQKQKPGRQERISERKQCGGQLYEDFRL